MNEGPKTARAAAADTDGATLITTLALALRSVAVYPATHPRVTSTAADLTALLAGRLPERRATSVGHHGDRLWVDDLPIMADDGQASWLLQRFRDAGLRGLSFQPDCTAEDVVELALTLNQARSRTGQAFASLWPKEHARITAHELVFHGTFHDDGEAAHDAGNDSAVGLLDAEAQQRRLSMLSLLGKDSQLGQRMASIQSACGIDAAASHELNLFATIADLLPADVAAHPELAAEKVIDVLSALERELPTSLRDGGRIDEGDLLRTALRVARKYFQTEAPEQPLRHNLPSGRPGDEGIDADLPALLRELEALPDSRRVRLPARDELVAAAPKVQRELFGIFLHVFANTEREEVRRAATARLATMLRTMDLGRMAFLAAYLAEPGAPGAIPERRRAELLLLMVTAGQAQTVRDYGYVDAGFVTRCYPRSLAIAAKVLMTRTEDLAVFRRGLESLTPMLAMGGVQSAEELEVLGTKDVVEALLRIGGKTVLPLLRAAAQGCPADLHAKLVGYALRLELPGPERAVLEALQPSEEVPRDYLQTLLDAAAKARFGPEVRTAGEEALVTYVLSGIDTLPLADLTRAIACLRHVPSPQTEALLAELGRRGRFSQFGERARAIRSTARDTLAAITPNVRP